MVDMIIIYTCILSLYRNLDEDSLPMKRVYACNRQVTRGYWSIIYTHVHMHTNENPGDPPDRHKYQRIRAAAG